MMLEAIGSAAMLEQLAEESAELAQAALKVARILRGDNPTPVTLKEAEEHLVEEYTDVYQCVMEATDRGKAGAIYETRKGDEECQCIKTKRAIRIQQQVAQSGRQTSRRRIIKKLYI